jgi:hypothetical protein
VIRHDILVAVDYRQFYLWDAGVNPSAPTDYSDDDVSRMVKVAPNVVVIQPVRDFAVPVQLELHDHDPGIELTNGITLSNAPSTFPQDAWTWRSVPAAPPLVFR